MLHFFTAMPDASARDSYLVVSLSPRPIRARCHERQLSWAHKSLPVIENAIKYSAKHFIVQNGSDSVQLSSRRPFFSKMACINVVKDLTRTDLRLQGTTGLGFAIADATLNNLFDWHRCLQNENGMALKMLRVIKVIALAAYIHRDWNFL